jgi:tetratricopeptide (TPR) repeat protein
VVFLGAQGCRRWQENSLLQRAARAQDFSPEQTAAWTAALAVEPDNFETTYALGEVRRLQSMAGNRNYETLARQAIAWYERGMTLNPHDGNNWLRRGMCRDWLELHDAAAADFTRAEALDPNGYYTLAHVGWHHVQTGNYALARDYFERSLRLHYVNNPVARRYLEITERKLLEAATKP